jgi:diguanylate cyclase (GGDEF)-like protein/PAS domain S-box-containing protein
MSLDAGHRAQPPLATRSNLSAAPSAQRTRIRRQILVPLIAALAGLFLANLTVRGYIHVQNQQGTIDPQVHAWRGATALAALEDPRFLLAAGASLLIALGLVTLFYVLLGRVQEQLDQAWNQVIDAAHQRETGQLAHVEEVKAARQTVIDGIADPVMVLNPTRRILLANRALCELTGMTPANVIGSRCETVFARCGVPCTAAGICPIERQARSGKAGTVMQALRNAAGETRKFEILISPDFDAAGTLRQIVLTYRDVSARLAAQEAMRTSEERYALAARGASDGLWDWDFATGRVYYSPRWHAMLGLEPGTLPETPAAWFERVHADDLPAMRSALERHLQGLTPHFENEHRMRHADGTSRWMLCRAEAVRDPAGRPTRLAGSQTDITDRKLAEEQLRHAASHDALTGLANRTLFIDRLQRGLERRHRHPEYCFAVLFLDLDHFKLVNDSLGHLIGDELLVQVAERLRNCLRGTDYVVGGLGKQTLRDHTVARLGGDEFTLLLEDIRGSEDAVRVAERLQETLAQPIVLRGQAVHTGVSIGIAVSDEKTARPEDLLRDADTALYRAKANGRGRFEVFDTRMHAQALARLQLEHDLRRALELEEFVVYYQPIVDVARRRVVSMEALVRWQHPTRGLVAPAEFIPVAEETGLIIPLGQQVLRAACRQAHAWRSELPEHSDLTVAVNLSSHQVRHPELLAHVGQILRETGLEPGALELELTESALIDQGPASVRVLRQLKDLGIHLHLDDFGTGYSSLSYLRRFPLDVLKIDRSFVAELSTTTDGAAVVRAIIDLAHNLQLKVIAEGVEGETQLEILAALGADYAQGYFFAKPLTAAAMHSYLLQPAALPAQAAARA